MFFQKTSQFGGWYVYLGRYVFEKLPRRGVVLLFGVVRLFGSG